MKTKKIVLIILGLFIIGGWITRVVWLNHTYPDVTREVYEAGDVVELGEDVIYYESMEGYSVRLEGAKVWDYEDFMENYQVSDEIRQEVEEFESIEPPEKVYVLTITLINQDNTETGIFFRGWNVQSSDLFLDLNEELYRGANPGIDTVSVALRENSEKTFHLVYNMREFRFREAVWEEIEQYPMWLSVTAYPTKKMIKVN